MQHSLSDLVRSHLFVLSSNNGGSTFVKNALALAPTVWSLHREGHRTFGFRGPELSEATNRLTWAARPEWIERYRSSPTFDWTATRQAWYAQATALRSDAAVFVEKSPPFILVARQLATSFHNPHFVVLVRNPYAQYEGILRRLNNWEIAGMHAPDLAARHIAACLELQSQNLDSLGDRAILLRYEDLCADPYEAAERVVAHIPELLQVNFDQQIAVKGMYDEQLRDMNSDQIARLTTKDIEVAHEVFETAAIRFNDFGYSLTPPTAS